MKAFLVVCLAVAAVAESDPALLAVNPYAAHPAAYNPLVYSHPVAYNAHPVAYNAHAFVKPVVTIKKTEEVKPVEYIKPVEYKTVEVEGEKKFEVPAISYKTPVVGTTYAATNIFGAPVAYQAGVVGHQETIVPARYHAQSEGQVKHTVFKREAEADPAFLAYANTYAAHPFAYSSYVAPTVYKHAAIPAVYKHAAVPSVYAHPAVYPSVYANVNAGVKTYANDAVRPENYAAKGQYVAQSAGAIHIAKREAEADPALVYANAGYPYAAHSVYAGAYATPSVYSTAYTTPYVYGAYNAYNTLGYRHFY